MSPKPLKAVATLAAVCLLAAACGSSSSSGGSSSTTKAATGSLIMVGQILPLSGANLALPEVGNSLAASITALNNTGGINGHPMKLIQCDSQGVASVEVQCAQQMVSDHVVATLADNTFSAEAQVQGIFNAAGIPRIGIEKADPSEYESPLNFDFTGGGIFILVAMMDALIHKGDKKLSVLVPDSPQAAETHLLLDPIAHNQGAKVVNYVLVSSASGDYSQYVAQAQENGAQGMALALPNAQLFQVAQAINQLSPKIDYTTGIAGLSLNQLKQLGQFSTKASYVWWTPGVDDVKNFPGLAQPVAQLTTYMKNANVNNLTAQSLTSWLAVHAFYEVMKARPGTPTAASVLAAFKEAKDVPMNGLISPWTPTDYQSAGSFSSIFQNVSNPWAYRVAYNGTGTQTSASQTFNTFAGL